MKVWFNMRTIALFSGLISFVLCFCMLFIYISRKTYKGFLFWVIASFLNALGLMLLSLRSYLPDFITIVTANTLIISSAGFNAYGLEVFYGDKGKKQYYISASIMIFISLIYFTYRDPDVNARIVIISSVWSLLFSYCLYIIYRRTLRQYKEKNLLLSGSLIFLIIANLYRIFPTVFYEGKIIDFMDASVIQGILLEINLLAHIFIATGLIVLNFQRVEYDLNTVLREIKTLRGIIPICANCKKIRNDEGVWRQLESYIEEHSEVEFFSHGICPECTKKLYPEV
ncbi:MAG: hypothetical protein H7A26_00885 [Spirochaetales bacterium]|nr:hypothetical protein [Spirochaetales bacterium]